MKKVVAFFTTMGICYFTIKIEEHFGDSWVGFKAPNMVVDKTFKAISEVVP